jgi:diguanylate cyclase (GGDEF)-like protein
MTGPGDKRSASGRLRGLLEVTRLVRSGADVDTLLAAIARTTAESLGYGVVVMNLYCPEWDDFRVEAIHGGEAALEALVGDVRGWDVWNPILDERFAHRGAYVIRHGTFDWSAMTPNAYVPDIPEVDDLEMWHPEDMLVVPLRHSDGHLLGILGVDEPAGGRHPDDDDIDALVAVAAHAALAIQSAQESGSARRHREALEQLLQVSSQLTETFSIESILESVCLGIQRALGFSKLSIELPDPDTGRLVARAAVGWDLSDETVTSEMTLAELTPLMEQEYEIEGCYLLSPEQALGRVDQRHWQYHSEMSGRGPNAWTDHWLFVPLWDRTGDLSGVIWVDDPQNRLVPGSRTLQALRVFANQASTALDAAAQFEEMRFLADHDPLTRLLNRRVFSERLSSESARYVRYGRPFSLIVCDLDGFKQLNDARGHLSGDAALEGFAELLADGRREVDGVFRIGGDEFALLLPEAGAAEAQAVVDRVREVMASNSDPRLARLGASFGVAACPDDGEDPPTVFRAADRAMYAAKAQHRPAPA